MTTNHTEEAEQLEKEAGSLLMNKPMRLDTVAAAQAMATLALSHRTAEQTKQLRLVTDRGRLLVRTA